MHFLSRKPPFSPASSKGSRFPSRGSVHGSGWQCCLVLTGVWPARRAPPSRLCPCRGQGAQGWRTSHKQAGPEASPVTLRAHVRAQGSTCCKGGWEVRSSAGCPGGSSGVLEGSERKRSFWGQRVVTDIATEALGSCTEPSCLSTSHVWPHLRGLNPTGARPLTQDSPRSHHTRHPAGAQEGRVLGLSLCVGGSLSRTPVRPQRPPPAPAPASVHTPLSETTPVPLDQGCPAPVQPRFHPTGHVCSGHISK